MEMSIQQQLNFKAAITLNTILLVVILPIGIPAQSNMQTISRKQANEMIYQLGAEPIGYIDFNDAVLLKSKDKFLIMPIEGKLAVLADSESAVTNVKGPEDLSFIGRETDDVIELMQDSVLDIENTYPSYIAFLNNKLNLNLSSKEDTNDLMQLSEALQPYQVDNEMNQMLLVSVNIYLMNLIVQNYGGKWCLAKVSTLKTYYTPQVCRNDDMRKFSFGKVLSEGIQNSEKLDLLWIYRLELANFLGLKPFSIEDAYFMKTGLIKPKTRQ